jgi:hypothetical protein
MTRTPPPRTRPRRCESGSLLLEATTGVALLAVLTASLATFHGSALAADVRASARLEALRTAERALEEQQAGLGHMGDGPHVVVVRSPIDGDPCAPFELAGFASLGVRVPVVADGAATGETIVLTSVGPSALAGTGVLVRLRDAPMPEVAAVATMDAVPGASDVPGAPAGVGVSAVPGCIAAVALDGGRHELRIEDGPEPALVDRLHRPAEDAPLPVSSTGGLVRRTWDLADAAQVTVHAHAAGARLPDRVDPGVLGWLVRGDDLRVVTPLGSSRAVHPGTVTVVVSACANPEAPAASARLTVTPGGTATTQVTLATLVVRNVAAHPTATLQLVRLTGCQDGTGLRPAISWDGGLAEGMRVALPHGEWEARLQTASGTRITGPVLVRAGGAETELVLP